MERAEMLTIFDYDGWATEKVLKATETLTPDQFSAPQQCGHNSIRDTLVHMLSAGWIWRLRCQEGLSPDQFIEASLFPTPSALRDRMVGEQTALRDY